MTPKNPKKSPTPPEPSDRSRPEGREDKPRYDDRPERRQNPDLPTYGDTEPNDPRRLDIEAGRQGRGINVETEQGNEESELS